MLLEVGRIDRPHGLAGDVVVTLVTNHLERLEPGSLLEAEGRWLEVLRARPAKHRFVVHFAGVDTPEAAAELSGTPLRAEAVQDDPDGYWVHDLVGAEVIDVAGQPQGMVTEVLSNPASDVLVLGSGVLIPLRFATWDDDGRLVVDGPEGLLDPPGG
ncbi:MAG: 16S rRNA processing protein RimM [Acidimicrobiia bacterium]|nr:16S rRNA processing protein RimM [Acidimicrobiia bacterium]